MERNELIANMRKYNKTLSEASLTSLEKQYVQNMEEKSYFYGFHIENMKLPESAELFIKEQNGFRGLLKENGEKLCSYLRHIQEFTCNDEIIRMDVRSGKFSRYAGKVRHAIGAFYLFYGLGLSMRELIYGEYRDLCYGEDFPQVIAIELLQENAEVIQYCKDVLLSENNTAVLTRGVIVAIEQSHNQELQDLLTQMLLAAKLQEGFRQSIMETVDENNREYFLKMLGVIEQENLIRFSSVQRAVQTWIGLGYETVEEKEIRYIFSHICQYFKDENARKEALINSENPLDTYLALYCRGTEDVETAIQEACELLESPKWQIVASALIYLKLTKSFDIGSHLYFTDYYADDEWIMALFYSECVRNMDTLYQLTWEEAEKLYNAIEVFLPTVGSQKTWTSKGFAWFAVSLCKETLAYCLFEILDKYPEKELVERFLPYAGMINYKRLDRFMEKRFDRASEEARKEFLLKEVLSSSDELVKWVGEKYLTVNMTEEDIVLLEGRLKSKKAKSRACIVRVLAAQDQEQVVKSYERLAASKVKTIQESAQELKNLKTEYFDNIPVESDLQESDEFKEIIPIQGHEDGFGMYTPNEVISVQYENCLKIVKKGLFKKTESLDMSFLLPWDKKKVLDYIRLWNQRIAEHEDDEYYNGYMYRQVKENGFWPLNYQDNTLNAMPLSEVWREYFRQDKLGKAEVFEIQFMLATRHDAIFLEKNLGIQSGIFTLDPEDVKECQYIGHFENIFSHYYNEIELENDFADSAMAVLAMIALYSKTKTYDKKEYNNVMKACAITSNRSIWFLTSTLHLDQASDEKFRKYFPVILHLYNNFNVRLPREIKEKFLINPVSYARAVNLGMISKERMYEGILDNHIDNPGQYYYYRKQENQLFEAYRDAYFEGKGTWGKPHLSMEKYQHNSYQCGKEVYECLRNGLDDIADRLLAMEVQRLNEKTVVTDYVQQLVVIRGIDHLIQALHVLEGEQISRQTYGDDRNVVFSNVIRHCYPEEKDDAGELLKKGFSEERLVEVAMLAPQWMDKINEVIGWDGFKEACYYFIAHMKQYTTSDEKKAEIAKYTDLEPEDLNDGAFDMQWCRDIFETLGKKRFQVIYKASKFLCENAFHTRARKYADACLGNVPKEEWRIQAEEKRNKDALNAYCICPLEDDKDLLERYLFVQKFLKESKKFGSQRQASEKRACEMALLNLARNSRFETVTRLSWMMESEMISQNAWALEPMEVAEGIELWIEIDEQGSNEIVIRKNGKMQKSVPAAVKKNEKYLELKEIHTQWKEQYRRSRKMLEQAMEERSEFRQEELEAIISNQVVSPMMKKLVLVSGEYAGVYEDGKLRILNAENEVQYVPFAETVRIAHPYDLYAAGCWQDYQKLVFEKGIVQPFKQVFRELYLPMEEEKDMAISRRYSGYQIQPKKAAAALKSRKWNVSYENGLERVYYKENLVVNLYAEADWFSPSDVEAPSIEYVAFYSRKGTDKIRIRDIDPVVFSEVMRDIDLAVSVAYVGGVDPITSFSTMELRKTIVEYTCGLMKLANVSVQEHFADIKGGLNDYSVHLGSGVIHQAGGAAIHILAVQSQKRGKVYLPFLDEDPKTAEIISKIVLLAEDGKIKDPEILRQIQRKSPLK